MPIENWLAFTAAAAILLAIPGPTILLVISYALGHGRRPAAAIVAGVALGDLTAMTASMAGLGALLATSAELFTLLRWVGAAYLVYLGLKLWRAPVRLPGGEAVPALGLGRIFGHAYAVTALNPKSLVFFVAFVPQFLSPAAPFLPQVGVMVATFVTMAAANAALYGWLAASARGALRRPGVQRAVNRTGGGLLVGAGLLSALWRKSPA
ncbi:LysE family translocator [Pseudoroseomonas cervicalis]|uniref:LysE family translocator n=1 Tax=Teichococcus cervicalis TaxID=204525 RepID=UPI00277ECA5C|nr:LysE family translocator [Pseudoroseomonas cervicalis]MDQ1080333.1 threonine/homoserine/homoserine lactone efflux protein [Pseudoroseomonas cervicalis]